jgi:hypothetical protein
MNAYRTRSFFLIAALAGAAQPIHAEPPPNVVESDAFSNTAMGTNALVSLTDGSANTASGYEVLRANTTGYHNSAFGAFSLYNNTSGFNNIAFGLQALFLNETGYDNVAIGLDALYANTSGSENIAIGLNAIAFNTSGKANTATGFLALERNETGIRNVGFGYRALQNNTAGRNNTAIGWAAGDRTTGNDNVLVAHRGRVDESQTMRLGTRGTAGVAGSGVTRTFIAGVRGVTTGGPGVPVLVDSNGQLGTVSSSRRVKQDIQPMDEASERLLGLRPVQFRYTQPDASGERPVQYGLIAEEVAEILPELVVLDEGGQPETVAYHMLPALLLNELQKQREVNLAQSERLAKQEQLLVAQASSFAELNTLRGELAEVKELLAALRAQSTSAQ